jgi:phosphoserine phosphatase
MSLWREGEARDRILNFVRSTATEGSPEFVEPEDRIAVFDNDGTLWVEHPMYTQLAFILSRKVRNPGLNLDAVRQAVAAEGEKALERLLSEAVDGQITEELQVEAREWVHTAKHPRFDRPYVELTFAPQLQLMKFLRRNGYRTFIVSGGGVEFMRSWSQKVYGIPPEQVIGSSLVTEYEVVDGRGVLVQRPKMHLVDDGPGKPVGINQYIGRRPIIAVGNSDGDFEMLEYVTTGKGPRLGIYIHHDDAEREYAYDRGAHFGALERGLDEATARGWIVVSMKNDWVRIFAHEA